MLSLPIGPPGLSTVAQAALTVLIGSGLGYAAIVFVAKMGLKSKPEFIPVVQKGADYVEWAELTAIHAAEVYGLKTNEGSAAKLRFAVDKALLLLADCGIEAHGESLTISQIQADIETLVKKVYPPKK